MAQRAVAHAIRIVPSQAAPPSSSPSSSSPTPSTFVSCADTSSLKKATLDCGNLGQIDDCTIDNNYLIIRQLHVSA